MMRKRLAWLLVALLCCGMLAGCAGGSPPSSGGGLPETPSKKNPVSTPTTGSGVESRTLKVYFATRDAMYLVPESRTVNLASAQNPAKAALEILATGPQSADLVAVLPAGSVVRELRVKDGVAYADFNDVITKKHTGGSTAERLTVVAIVNTLTEFPDIHKVQILVEGKHVGTLAGHLDVSQPLSRSEELNKK